jgi:hypothetical protein
MYRRFMTLIDRRRSLVTLSGHHDTTHLLILGRECYEEHLPHWSGFILSLSDMGQHLQFFCLRLSGYCTFSEACFSSSYMAHGVTGEGI